MPYDNINGAYVNVDSSNYSGTGFTSTTNPATININSMPEPRSNIDAANSYISCPKGGTKNKNKNKKIMYKMSKTNKRKIGNRSSKNKTRNNHKSKCKCRCSKCSKCSQISGPRTG